MSATGDTPLLQGVILYIPEPGDPPPQGDTVRQGEVHLLGGGLQLEAPTADELRANDYVVPEDAPGDEPPATYMVDTPTPEGEVHLIDEPAPESAEPEAEPPPEPTPDEPEIDESGDVAGDVNDPVFAAGQTAQSSGSARSSNPYDGRSKDGRAWLRGWDAAQAPQESTPEETGA